MSGRPTATAPLAMIAGLALWGAAFSTLYGAQALGCAARWDVIPMGPTNLHRVVLIGMLVSFLCLHGLVILKAHRRRAAVGRAGAGESWVATVALAIAWVGAAATLTTGGPALGLTLCE